MEIPKLINWAITNCCNLKCGFCFKLNDCDASFEDKKYIFNRMVESGIEQITFTGGEPLLDRNLAYFAYMCDKYSIKSSLHTNATLTEQFYQVCNSFDRISFSLDGSTPTVNEIMRGYDSYLQSILEKINYLKAYNKDFVIKTIVTRQNAGSVLEMVPLIKELKPTFWSIFEFRPLRIGQQNKNLYSLSDIFFNELITDIRMNIADDIPLNIRSNKEASEHPIFLVSGKGLVYTNDFHKGDVLIGSLMESSVKDIWKKIVTLNGMNESYENRNLNLIKRS